MRELTLNGIPITILYDFMKKEYVVFYDGDTVILKERPQTDQDIEDLERERDRLLREIEATRLEITVRGLSSILVDLLSRGL